MQRFLENPVLPGFHPDPSIVRVDRDYYLATSTFEWFPGVRLHHSRDLCHWRPIGHALTRRSQLDLLSVPRSGGIWAPCLSFHDGRFYLVYTIVRGWGRGFVDCHNYLVTAERIEGPWSDPTYLNSSGFDPSLFHDRDGKKWLSNMVWDHRPGRNQFAGITLQEYSEAESRLVGDARFVFHGTALGCTEGPHLYRRAEAYYLMIAEGGTSFDHAVTLARASRIEGPYQADPDGPLLTARHDASLALQKAGHASLVDTPQGEWFIAHLCGRPSGPERRCVLGRETAIQRVRWTADGWLRLDTGNGPSSAPAVRVPAPALEPHPFVREPTRDDFDAPELGPHYQTLRDVANAAWLSLTARPGHLRLVGRESLQSLSRQSLVARRVQSLRCRIETMLEFSPENFQQSAGLVCLYDDQNFYYACLTWDDDIGRCLVLLRSRNDTLELASALVPVSTSRVWLRAEFAGTELRFAHALDGANFQPLGSSQDATTLSDEHTTLGLGFTGAFAGMCAQDLSGKQRAADFDYFSYEELSAAAE
jgi:xylan 1,4-beta-xylosidase